MIGKPQTLAEKAEIVFQVYCKIFDLDLALCYVELTPEEHKALIADEVFNARLKLKRAEAAIEVHEGIASLAKHAQSEGVQLSALRDIGKAVHPERYNEVTVKHKQDGPFVFRWEIVDAAC